jgi:acyl-CoA thioesterase
VTPFARDTAVERISDARWRADLPERWSSLVGVHGGYVAAVAVRAIGEAIGDTGRPLRTVSVQFLRSARPGPVEIGVTIERRGTSLVFASARVHQGHRTIVLLRSISAGNGRGAGLEYDDARSRPRPAMPPPAAARFGLDGPVRHFRQFDVVMDPDVVPFAGQGPAWLAAWMRPLDDDRVDAAWLVAACDALPPAVFSRTTGPTRAATLDYTVHLPVADPAALVPPGSYVYLDCHSPIATDGLGIENGTLWGPDGTVLAVSRQTRLADARVPTVFAEALTPTAAPAPTPAS